MCKTFQQIILVALIFPLTFSCNRKKNEEIVDLAEYSQKLASSRHSYNSSKWVEIHKNRQIGSPDEKIWHCLNMGIEQIRAGATEAGIHTLDSLNRELSERNKNYEEDALKISRSFLALGYLRLGEQQNCIQNHTNSSCIIPLDSTAIYDIKDATEEAIEHYKNLLGLDAEDYESRYLLNLAYMALGQYPNRVPPKYHIENELLEKPSHKWVVDRAMEKKLATIGLAGGVIAEDFDQDGFLDIMISSWDMRTNVQLFLNSENGHFKERTREVGLATIPGGLNMVQTDYNNDGWPDILVLRGGWLGLHGKIPNTLLRNNGMGSNGSISFTDVTRDVGLIGNYPTQTAVWADFDNDGRLDVFIGNESAVTGFRFPSQLFMNSTNGTFSDMARQSGLQINDSLAKKQFTIKGVTVADYDKDGWTDIFVSTRNAENFLFRNKGLSEEGVPQFEDVTEQSGLGGDYKTFTCWFWDYDNDGFEDILAAGFDASSIYEGKSISHDFGRELLGMEHSAQTGLLFRNNGDGTFTDASRETGLDKILYMMGGNFGDIDNDGWLDFYCGNGDPDLRAVIPNRMFRFNGKKFKEITNQGFGHIQKGHGTAFADFDQDGDQDIYMVVGGFYEGDVYQNVYFENRSDTANNHVNIRLKGSRSNSYGVGSKLRLVINDNGDKRVIYRTVNSGGSFGASSFVQHIGLGKATGIDSLEIRWAGSHTVQVLTNLPAHVLHTVEERITLP